MFGHFAVAARREPNVEQTLNGNVKSMEFHIISGGVWSAPQVEGIKATTAAVSYQIFLQGEQFPANCLKTGDLILGCDQAHLAKVGQRSTRMHETKKGAH